MTERKKSRLSACSSDESAAPDRFVRVFHWSNAALLLTTYGWLEGGERAHELGGYAVGALLAARIAWGFAGSPRARFRNFVPTPARLYAFLRRLPASLAGEDAHRAGYSPAGALMILALLFVSLVCVVSGWMQTTSRWWGEEWVQTLHAYASHGLVVLAGIHVTAVIAVQRISGVPLVRRMLAGKPD